LRHSPSPSSFFPPSGAGKENEKASLLFLFCCIVLPDLFLLLSPRGKKQKMDRAPRVLQRLPDESRRVKFAFELRYLECDLAPEQLENRPVVQMFLSSHFERDQETGGVVNIHLDEHDLSRAYVGSLVGGLKREHKALPPMAAICIDSYAVHRNDQGHACYRTTGTAHVRLKDIVQAVRAQGYYEGQLDLLMRTVVVSGDAPIKKGTVGLRVTALETGHAVSFSSSSTSSSSALEAPIEAIENSLVEYVQATLASQTSMPDLIKGIERVQAPMDISSVGISSTGGMFLPAVAYAMAETPRANTDFFHNAYLTVLRRRNLKPSDWRDMDLKERCRIMGNMLCAAVQTFDYVGDEVFLANRRIKTPSASGASGGQRVGIEDFGPNVGSWITAADDCETDGAAIKAVLAALCAVKLEKNVRVSEDEFGHLREIQSLAQQYRPFLVLAVVHGAKIGDEEGIGAHMYLCLTPDEQFRNGLARTPEGREMTRRMAPATAPPSVFSSISSGVREAERLPHLTCEGTGILDVIGYAQPPLLEEIRYVMSNAKSVHYYKREIPRKELAESTFYLADVLAISDTLIKEGINVGSFVLCTADSSSLKRGVYWTEHINSASPAYAVMPHPKIPQHVMDVIREANALNPPPRPLEIDYEKPMLGTDRHPDLDYLVQQVRTLKRTGQRARGSVDFVLRPHQFNRERIAEMLGDIRSLERIFDADYCLERITNTLYNYRVMLFVNPAPQQKK
jgi:hypothetical protein